jgi:hypothetical protein
MTVRGVA